MILQRKTIQQRRNLFGCFVADLANFLLPLLSSHRHVLKLFRFPRCYFNFKYSNIPPDTIIQSLIFTRKCSQTGSFVQLCSMKILPRKNDRWTVRESWAKIQIEILIGLRSWILRGRVQSPRIYAFIYAAIHWHAYAFMYVATSRQYKACHLFWPLRCK